LPRRPLSRRALLALWAMAITARVVAHAACRTPVTLQGEAPKRRGATLGEMTQHLSPSPIERMLRLIGRQKLRQHLL